MQAFIEKYIRQGHPEGCREDTARALLRQIQAKFGPLEPAGGSADSAGGTSATGSLGRAGVGGGDAGGGVRGGVRWIFAYGLRTRQNPPVFPGGFAVAPVG